MSDERKRADEAYGSARRRAWFRDVLKKLAGRPNQLLSYQQVKDALRLGGPVYRGMQEVPVAKIVGSVDRYRDFDEVFLPAQDRTANRWKSVARAYYRDIDLPPIRLYKVGEAYFVIDGHHRVSVARDQGVDYIDAEVQEVISRVPVSADVTAEDLRVLHEYRRFLDRTRLDLLRPDQRIRFTVAGGYDRLVEHIAMHRVYMQVEQQRAVEEADAIEHWYDTVYVPIVDVIRDHQVLAEFPGRTEADLYLWVVEHLHFLRETEPAVSIADAAEDYADQFSQRPIKKIVRAVTQALVEPSGPDFDELKAQQARQEFLARTQLDTLWPGHTVQCTSDLGYAQLQEHIERHRYYMGLDFKRDVSDEEAVRHWYEAVYAPIARAIHENDLLAEFVDRTETDLYLSIIDYLDQARQQDGSVTVDQAAASFVEDYAGQFSQHPIKKVVRSLRIVFGLASDDDPDERVATGDENSTEEG